MIVTGNFESYAYALVNLNGGLVKFISRDKFDGVYEIINPIDFDNQIDENSEIMVKFNSVISYLKSEFGVIFS